ncbi:MAG: sensor histidine kinase, partial [Nonomuraea sp.]|nr:sensor histidine kinase [Nonomuraea sp.]
LRTRTDLEPLALRLRHALASAVPDAALRTVVEVVREGLSAAGVAVVVDGGRVVAGEPWPVIREVPLVWHGEEVGRLLVGPSATGRRELAALTPYLADAAHAVRLAADLRRSQERADAIREEERHRLCRDLHDSLATALSDMAAALDAARTGLRTTPAAADRLLIDLRASMDVVSRQIRELTYGLR